MTEKYLESSLVSSSTEGRISKMQDVSSVYKRDRKEITKEFLRAAGTWGAFFWLLKVELILNFIQFFALFFGHIYTKALDIVKISYGRIFAIFALDFHVVDSSVNPGNNLRALLYLGLIIGLITLCVLPLVVRLRGFEDKDEKSVSLKSAAEAGACSCFYFCVLAVVKQILKYRKLLTEGRNGNRPLTYFAIAVVALVMMLYIPVVRAIFETVNCAPTFTRALVQKDFIASASVIGENPLDGWNETSTNDTDPEPNKCLLLADALNDGASNADIIDGEHDEPFLNQTFIVDFGDCKCENWDGGLESLASLLLFGWVVCCPFCFQNIIGDNKPRGSEENPHYRYNEEGQWVEYHESEYLADLRSGWKQLRNPVLFLYGGYMPRSCYHEVVMMLVKIFVVIFIVRLYNSPVTQAVLCFLVFSGLLVFMYFRPHFIDKDDALVYVSGLIATVSILFFTIIGAAIDSSEANEAISSIIIIIISFYIIATTTIFLWKIPKIRGLFKTVLGKPSFSDTVKKVEGTPREIAPQWNLAEEVRRRVWKPFWENILLQMDPKFAERVMNMEKQAQQWGFQTILNHWENSADESNARLRLRLMEELEGVDVYFNEDEISQAQDRETYRKHETRSEESSSNCIDKAFRNGGLFGALNISSRPPFGKLEIVWYPFHCIFTHDDTGERKLIWEDKTEELLRQNTECQEVLRQKEIRQKLRAMCGEYISYPYETWTKSYHVEDGKHENGSPAYSDVNVYLRFSKAQVLVKDKNGILVKDSKGEYSDERGFNLTILLVDGSGTGTKPRTGEAYSVSGQEHVLFADSLDIDAQFSDTPALRQVLNNGGNAERWQRDLPKLKEYFKKYRQNLIQHRCENESMMSSAFWMLVYENDTATEEEIDSYFRNFEVRPKLQQILSTHKKGLDYLMNKMNWINKHPCNALWFVFFHDFWEANTEVPKIAKLAGSLNPKEENTLPFLPMQRSDLETFLSKLGLLTSKRWLSHDTLDLLYELINKTDQAFQRFQEEHNDVEAKRSPTEEGTTRLSTMVLNHHHFVQAAHEFRRSRTRTQRVHKILRAMERNGVQNMANYASASFIPSNYEDETPADAPKNEICEGDKNNGAVQRNPLYDPGPTVRPRRDC